MIRRCDGTDPNLTREFTTDSDDLTVLDGAKLSPWDQGEPGRVVIQCDCGLVFSDVHRSVVWPHRWVR